MDKATDARLAAIETVLGIMMARLPMKDAQAILNTLRTTANGARRDPSMHDRYPQALANLDDLLSHWSRLAPQIRSTEATRAQSSSD
ncbi:hypothetical protein OKC48_20945 [Methylorubrum extorquens]|uniref:hypothetical protein n=1 Tax=Methylorubrum extorquens TaxID=408 RepID=UPI002238DCB4|nr:hypothetical protein [Methylorubrum extorquens]UYW25715.1 hypothetical protein OKC48_20945 [Methylorubrum extorquens]